jgi:hypothetical protein
MRLNYKEGVMSIYSFSLKIITSFSFALLCFTVQAETGSETIDRIKEQVAQARPPVLPDMPPELSRSMFGPMYTDPEFVAFRCELVLNPNGTPCDIATKILEQFDLTRNKLAQFDDTLNRTSVYNLNVFRSRAVDPELKRLELDKHFKYASGQQGNSVRVFGASESGINFLAEYPWGMMDEINAAGADYCAKQGRKAVFVGASEACMSPRRTQYTIGIGGVTSKNTRLTPKEQAEAGNGPNKKAWETWLLVAVDCVAEAGNP